MFQKYIIDFPKNYFEQLSKSVKFEDITNGRKGANLVECQNKLIPIVRTTTTYHKANQPFLPVHHRLVDAIKKTVRDDNLEFNNALVELYNSKYCTMGYHSDQSLDLKKDSYICIFSCYSNPNTTELRKLRVKNKDKTEKSYEYDIILDHNSAVVFSTDDNRKNLHKIILENNTDDVWLGFTFRLSNTFIYFDEKDNLPYFHNTNKRLTLADKNERANFLNCRRLENTLVDYEWTEINYTISDGDIIPIN